MADKLKNKQTETKMLDMRRKMTASDEQPRGCELGVRFYTVRRLESRTFLQQASEGDISPGGQFEIRSGKGGTAIVAVIPVGCVSTVWYKRHKFVNGSATESP
jgi:hypothetical protein